LAKSTETRLHILSICVNKHGHHRTFMFLIVWYFKIFSSETAWPNKQNLGRQNLWKILYKDCSFWSVNKQAHHRQFFFLISRSLKIFSSEITYPNKPKLGRKYLWKILYKGYSFCPDPLTNMVATCSWYHIWSRYQENSCRKFKEDNRNSINYNI
jgi:hypothetical protein